jgi:plastocyanin
MVIRHAASQFLALAMLAGAAQVTPALAADAVEVPITIKDHRFEPAAVSVPAGRDIKLIVTNADSTPEEFESKSLRIERVIQGGQKAEFSVRPLQKGQRYKFFGEFHEATAKGELIAK